MDPLWVLVILIGGASLCVAGAFIFIAVKVASVARQVAPKVTDMQEQLAAASAEIAKVSEAVQTAQQQFNRLADRASTASRRAAKVVDVVPHAIHKVRDADIRAKATVRAVGIVAARTIYAARERSLSSHEVTLK
jgi:methyl-accepting chemotaxis protein